MILGSFCLAQAQMRVQYPQEVRIDLGKKRSTKEERKARREARKKKREEQMDLSDKEQEVLSKADQRKKQKLNKAKRQFVSEISRAFPDIPVGKVKRYVGVVMTTDSLQLSSESLEGFVQPYYPSDSISRSKVSVMCQQLEQDLQPQLQKVLNKYGVSQELAAFNQSELDKLMAPEAPVSVLQSNEQLTEAMGNLQSSKDKFLQIDGLRSASKIASKKFLIPDYKNHFQGKEEVLAEAQSLVQIEKHKPSFKDILKGFLNQHQEALAEKKLLQRFELGGYIQYFFGQPSYLDVAPTLGFQLTGKATLGIGGNYRWVIGKEDANSSSTMPRQNTGYRAFFNYDLFGSLFFNNEFERLYVVKTNVEPKEFEWINGYLVGIGNETRVRNKVTMTVLLQYNMLYSAKTPYPNPWMLKVGFKI